MFNLLVSYSSSSSDKTSRWCQSAESEEAIRPTVAAKGKSVF